MFTAVGNWAFRSSDATSLAFQRTTVRSGTLSAKYAWISEHCTAIGMTAQCPSTLSHLRKKDTLKRQQVVHLPLQW